MADKKYNDLNITNNNPSYTNNNNINNINYNNRSGSGWTWFKTIFIACMLTIFSVVCFGGGINSLPKNYTNTMKNEIIRIPIGQSITINDLTASNLYKAKLKINTDNYVSFHELTNNTPNVDSSIQYVYTGGNNASYDITFGSMSGHYTSSSSSDVYNATLYYSIQEDYKYDNGKPYYNLYVGRYQDNFVHSNQFRLFMYNSRTSVKYYFYRYSYDLTIQFNKDIFNYLVDITPDLFMSWIKSNFILINVDDFISHYEYNVKYVTYNWDYKLEQLSYFKNIFTPIFNNNQEKNDLLLQQSFNKLQRWVENGAVEYIGDKQTNNVSYGNNWDYQILLNNNFVALSDYIEFFTSNTGKYINDNYYYNYDTKSFVQYSDVLYGSYNDELSTKEQIINILAYPLSTGFNILFNIGVIFTFILVW